MVNKNRADGYGVRSLVHGIVQSELFLLTAFFLLLGLVMCIVSCL